MNGFMNYFTIKYKNSSLQSKLFFSYFFLIFIPTTVLFWIFSYRSSTVVEKRSIDIANLYLNQTEEAVRGELLRLANISNMISQNPDIKRALDEKDFPLTFSNEFDKMKKVEETILSIKNTYDIFGIRLYINPQFLYSKSNYVTYSLNDIENEKWYHDIINSTDVQKMIQPNTIHSPLRDDQVVISIATPLRSYNNISKIIGVVVVDTPVERLDALLNTANYIENSYSFIINGNNELVYPNNQEDSFNKYKDIITNLNQNKKNESFISVNETDVIGISRVVYGDLRVCTVASFDTLLAEGKNLKLQMILLYSITGVIICVLAYYYAQYNSRRVKVLADQIKQVEKGDFSVNCIVDSEDEIGELQNSFNFMVKKINILLKERYSLGKNLKGMELKTLQAQINPHFLYNTLDLISWKAKAKNCPEIEDIIFKLARFYQLSLSNGKDFIPIKNEIEHIKLFVDLENMRLEHPVKLITDIDQSIEKYPIMKLIFQPIIENSIAHGIMNLDDREGIISISVKKNNDYIEIKISDNGIGIERKKLVSIQSHDQFEINEEVSGGFGLLNVINRLKVYYNDDYTFNINSVLNEGTDIIIKIPIEKKPEIYLEKQFNI